MKSGYQGEVLKIDGKLVLRVGTLTLRVKLREVFSLLEMGAVDQVHVTNGHHQAATKVITLLGVSRRTPVEEGVFEFT